MIVQHKENKKNKYVDRDGQDAYNFMSCRKKNKIYAPKNKKASIHQLHIWRTFNM